MMGLNDHKPGVGMLTPTPRSRQDAEHLASHLAIDDPDWQYRVVPSSSSVGLYLVEVRDEKGGILGWL